MMMVLLFAELRADQVDELLVFIKNPAQAVHVFLSLDVIVDHFIRSVLAFARAANTSVGDKEDDLLDSESLEQGVGDGACEEGMPSHTVSFPVVKQPFFLEIESFSQFFDLFFHLGEVGVNFVDKDAHFVRS